MEFEPCDLLPQEFHPTHNAATNEIANNLNAFIFYGLKFIVTLLFPFLVVITTKNILLESELL